MRPGSAPSRRCRTIGTPACGRIAATCKRRSLCGFARAGRIDYRPRSRARAWNSFPFHRARSRDRKMLLRRGFTVQPGQTAAVVEDVITTGGSTRDVIECCTRLAPRPRGRLDHRSQRRCSRSRRTPRRSRHVAGGNSSSRGMPPLPAGPSRSQARIASGVMRRIRITLAYDGRPVSRLAGAAWPATVQAAGRNRLRHGRQARARCRQRTHRCRRTCAGQVAAFSIENPIPLPNFGAP